MATSYGSITIVDVTDFGQFSVVPMSNAGISIIYDPNALSNKYNPASMTLTPYVNYGGKDMSSESGITYAWYKRTDGSTFNPETPGDAYATSQTLTVNASEFTSVKSITYYIKATYRVDGTDLVAYGQITISKVEQATNIQDIELSGDNIFKYKYTAHDQPASIDGNTSVTLTATYTSNVAVHAWYYYKKTNNTWTWTSLSNITGVTISGSTCNINHTAPIFYDNKAQIKVTAHRTDATSTELTNVYDTYSVLKLYDGQVGAPGNSSIAIIVSNEDQMIPCNGQGRPTDHAFDLASTTIEVLEGGENITTDDTTTGYQVAATPRGVVSTNGLQYDSTNKRYTYKVDGWASNNTSETGYVEFVATGPTGYQNLTKVMSLTKIQTGEDGESPTIYNLSLSPNRVTTNSNGQVIGQTVIAATVTSVKDTTTTDVTSSSEVYYEWFKNGSSTAETSHNSSYTISSGTSITSVLCKIRKTNSSGDILDSQSVAFVPAGAKGDKGSTGDGAITLDFPQSMDTIGLKNDGTLAAAYSLELPYTVYQGSTPIGGTASNSTTKGYSFNINDLDFSGNAKGTITWGTGKVTIQIPAGTKVYDSTKTGTSAHSLNGQCAIPIDYTATQTAADGTTSPISDTILATFTWNLDVAPANGSSVTITDTWTRYRQTNSSTQPSDISKTGTKDKETIEAAITAGGLSKPYYVWGRTHTTYSDGNSTDAYTVNYYPADPENGKSVSTTTNKQYACQLISASGAGVTPPSSGWNANKATAIGSTAKPYYVWERNIVSYKYSDNTSAGPDTTTYSVSYYPEDKVELNLTANATVFQGPIETITITPLATVNGTSHTVTASEAHWKYVVNGAMSSEITTTDNTKSIYKSGANLVIKKEAVNGATSVECRLNTSGQNVYAYLPIEDNTDEFRCDLHSTIGDKITNGQGTGFVICDLYRNGQLIDNITSTGGLPTVTQSRIPAGQTNARAATVSAPTDLATNTLTSDIQSITYQWSYQKINSNGGLDPVTDSTYNATGKAIYIDGSMIDKKLVISCNVSVAYKTS